MGVSIAANNKGKYLNYKYANGNKIKQKESKFLLPGYYGNYLSTSDSHQMRYQVPTKADQH